MNLIFSYHNQEHIKAWSESPSLLENLNNRIFLMVTGTGDPHLNCIDIYSIRFPKGYRFG